MHAEWTVGCVSAACMAHVQRSLNALAFSSLAFAFGRAASRVAILESLRAKSCFCLAAFIPSSRQISTPQTRGIPQQTTFCGSSLKGHCAAIDAKRSGRRPGYKPLAPRTIGWRRISG
eukprot:scaffold61113_cov32-Tisochrysis_lutea.AAC.1